jgi:predicted SnoaL-like aldol condensation-catalyzing enzyme
MGNQAEANKAVVGDFYDLAFNQKQPEEAARKYIGPYYRQHNPQVGDGPEPFIQYVRGFAQAFPDFRSEFKRFIAEGELVVVHSNLIPQPGSRGMAVIDIFRLEDGKIVEHWDVIQDVPESAANANTMF